MAPQISVSSDTLSSLGRAGHEIGVGALLGGNLFARVGMHPSLEEISDSRQRGKVLNRSWRRYGPVNSVALAAVVLGWAGARLGDARPPLLSQRERQLALAKDATVVAVAVTGLATMVSAIRFADTVPGGAVPMDSGDETSEGAPPESTRLKRMVRTLGSLHLASTIALAAVNAGLSQANYRRPPARRLFKRSY